MQRYIIIGLGGIGSSILEPLVRWLAYSNDPSQVVITLVDGDSFAMSNLARQACTSEDMNRPKVHVASDTIGRIAPELRVAAIPHYVQESNIASIIREGAVVFMCVDNHPARQLVNEHCDTLDNVILVSGGNEYDDGNAQIFVRKDGVRVTARLDEYHPEIATDTEDDKSAPSCTDEAAAGSRQLVFANAFAAMSMLMLFYSYLSTCLDIEDLDRQVVGEIFFDLNKAQISSRVRPSFRFNEA
jgi:molybdopterin/thiamine biosynthesis adenylyltransferase